MKYKGFCTDLVMPPIRICPTMFVGVPTHDEDYVYLMNQHEVPIVGIHRAEWEFLEAFVKGADAVTLDGDTIKLEGLKEAVEAEAQD